MKASVKKTTHNFRQENENQLKKSLKIEYLLFNFHKKFNKKLSLKSSNNRIEQSEKRLGKNSHRKSHAGKCQQR